MGIFKNFIRQTKSLFKKEDNVTGIVVKKLPLTYVAPCGTVVEKLRLTIDIEEGKEVAKFNPITGKLYWPSDGSEADGPGIRDIPNYKNLVHIFPELKEESEDERTRKALIKYYSFDKDGGSHALDNITPKQIVTWLEKQCKQKPTLPKWKYKKDNTPLSRDSLILNKYGCVAKSPSGALVSDVWVIDYDELAKLPKEEYEKQGEQKPTIEMKTPEESLGIDSDTYNKIVDECVYGEQKPAWSEEDEKILNYLLWFYDTRFRCNDTCGDDIKFGDIVTFLKSLKERYSWKPSDEQIKAIRLARSFVTDDFDEHPALSEILIELEKQLKKLREE